MHYYLFLKFKLQKDLLTVLKSCVALRVKSSFLCDFASNKKVFYMGV